MKIRWKLFLALFLVTGGVTVGVLVVAEREFRGWVRGQVLGLFETGVESALEARQERLDQTMKVSKELVEEEGTRDLLIAAFDRELREGELTRIRERCEGQSGPSKRLPGRAAARPMQIMALMGRDGELRYLSEPEMRRGGKERRAKIREFAKKFLASREQAVSYLKREEVGSRREGVREVVATPIWREGEMMGWFLLGQDAETSVDRAFVRVEEANGRQMRSGLVVDGEWFVAGLDPAFGVQLGAEVDEGFWEAGEPVEVTVDGEAYLLVAWDLNPGSPLGKGYQVGVFPLERLKASVGRLRWSVAGLGGLGLLLAGLVGWGLARRFSRPIDALVAGTARVKSGDFTGRVEVDSRDEFGMLAGAFNEMTSDLALKEKYHDVLGKTSDAGVVKRLIDGSLELGGEVREVAVIFCDIRGFTEMTEGMKPGGVIDFLNEHMTAMTEVIHRHGGVVDKFVGDLVMAVFGAPVAKEDDLERAARCAVEMVEECSRRNATGGRQVEIGVGMAWGEAVSGLMGSRDRLNYTVLGERVNLASRLCSLAAAGEVVVDGETARRIEGIVRTESRGKVAVKGFREAVEVAVLMRASGGED